MDRGSPASLESCGFLSSARSRSTTTVLISGEFDWVTFRILIDCFWLTIFLTETFSKYSTKKLCYKFMLEQVNIDIRVHLYQKFE